MGVGIAEVLEIDIDVDILDLGFRKDLRGRGDERRISLRGYESEWESEEEGMDYWMRKTSD